MEKADLKTSFFHYLFHVGVWKVIGILSSFLLLPVLARLFGTKGYGILTQIRVTILLLVPFIVLKSDLSAIRFLSDTRNPERDSEYSALTSLILCLVLFWCSVLFLLRRPIMSLIFKQDVDPRIYLIMLAMLAIEAVRLQALAFLQANQQIKLAAFLRSAILLTKLGAAIAVALCSGDLLMFLSLVVLLDGFSLVPVLIPVLRAFSFRPFRIGQVRRYVLYSLPLIPYMAFFWMTDTVDRYLITHFMDLSHTGLYSAAYTLSQPVLVVSMPLSAVLFPLVSKRWEHGDRQGVFRLFHLSVRAYLLFTVPIVVSLVSLAGPLVRLICGDSFSSAAPLVLPISLGLFMLNLFQILVYLFHIQLETRKLVWFSLVTCLINLSINLALLPRIGIMGAAIATFITYLALTVMVLVALRAYLKVLFDPAFTWKVAVMGLGQFVFSLCLLKIVGFWLVLILGIAFYVLAGLFLGVFSKGQLQLLLQALRGEG